MSEKFYRAIGQSFLTQKLTSFHGMFIMQNPVLREYLNCTLVPEHYFTVKDVSLFENVINYANHYDVSK